MTKFNATVEWELDEHDVAKASAHLLSLLPEGVIVKSIRAIKPKTQGNYILGVFSPDEVFPFLQRESEKRAYKVGDKTYNVRMNSKRLAVFKDNPCCVACGLQGTQFALEAQTLTSTPHFNFYGLHEGEMVVLTKDHIIAKAKGGKDSYTNYQTLCATCNTLKADALLTQEALKELRAFYDENRKSLKRKELAALISKKRKELAPPKSRNLSRDQLKEATKQDRQQARQDKVKAPNLTLRCDINIYSIQSDFKAYAIQAKDLPLGSHHIASIRRGVQLRPVGIQGVAGLVIELDGGFRFTIPHGMLHIS